MAGLPNIHIIDDDPSVRESLKVLLGQTGYAVHLYPGAHAFLESGGNVDGCALVDLRLPDIDGITLQKEIIARKLPLAVIMMSAYGDIEHAVTAMRLGAVDFVEKPFDPDHLLDRINSLMSASRDVEQLRRQTRRNTALIETLTPREKQVLGMITDGLPNKEVAAELGISARTVETHRVHVMQKLGADSLPHLVRMWLNSDHASPPPERA